MTRVRMNSAQPHSFKNTVTHNGFSLIEALIAIAMVSLIIVVLGSAFSSMRRAYNASDRSAQALGYVQEALDIISLHANDETMFACIGTVDASCNAPLDGQPCNPLPGFKSCWTTYARNRSTNNDLHVSAASGHWELLDSPETIVAAGGVSFVRKIDIDNLCRDSNGALDTATCIVSPNSKKITVTVTWNDGTLPKTVALSKILNAWKSL